MTRKYLIAPLFLMGFFLAVGGASLLDRRYLALKRLNLSIRIIRTQGGKND